MGAERKYRDLSICRSLRTILSRAAWLFLERADDFTSRTPLNHVTRAESESSQCAPRGSVFSIRSLALQDGRLLPFRNGLFMIGGTRERGIYLALRVVMVVGEGCATNPSVIGEHEV